MASSDMNAEEIFLNAVENKNEAEGQQFLAEACAHHPELREDVEKLLAAHERFDSFLASTHVGQQIGPYQLMREIGRGGMGIVYLTNDARLNRKVALKLLPHGRSHDNQWLQCFRREASSASALNHPNILTIHEIGDADGIHFIATEFVDGSTLREKLSNQRLTVSEATGFAVQLASAMAAILNCAPKSLSEFHSDAPAELGKILFKCLSKDSDKRFSSAELLSELK